MVQDFEGSWGPNSNIQVQNTFTDEGVPACQVQGQQPAGVDCEDAKAVADHLPGWEKHSQTNCYADHGATVVAPDAYWSTETISPTACMAGCAAHAADSGDFRKPCTAVVTTDQGECYFRADIDVDQCDTNIDESLGSFNLWIAPGSPAPAPPTPAPAPGGGWVKHAMTNCYPGQGAETQDDWQEPYKSDVSLDECEASCMQDERCSGVVVKNGKPHGPCFLRSNIDLGQCVRNWQWNTWQRTSEIVV